MDAASVILRLVLHDEAVDEAGGGTFAEHSAALVAAVVPGNHAAEERWRRSFAAEDPTAADEEGPVPDDAAVEDQGRRPAVAGETAAGRGLIAGDRQVHKSRRRIRTVNASSRQLGAPIAAGEREALE